MSSGPAFALLEALLCDRAAWDEAIGKVEAIWLAIRESDSFVALNTPGGVYLAVSLHYPETTLLHRALAHCGRLLSNAERA